jgi:hypothetical protein
LDILTELYKLMEKNIETEKAWFYLHQQRKNYISLINKHLNSFLKWTL